MTARTADPHWPCDRLAARDADAWTDAFARLYPWMLDVVGRLTAHRSGVVRDAADGVVGDLFARWPRVMASFAPPDDPADLPDRLRGYVEVILRNDVFALLRRHRFRYEHTSLDDPEFGEDGWDPAEDDSDDEYYDLVELRLAIGTLPEADQELIRWVFWDDLKLAEIARRRGTSVATAHRRVVQATDALRRLFSDTIGA